MPSLAPALHCGIEQNPSKRKANQHKDSEIGEQFGTMIEHVMPHLVRHDGPNFRNGALFQQIVIERHARCAE